MVSHGGTNYKHTTKNAKINQIYKQGTWLLSCTLFSNAGLFFMPPYLAQPAPDTFIIRWIVMKLITTTIFYCLWMTESSGLVFFMGSNFLIFSSFCLLPPPNPSLAKFQHYDNYDISDLVPSLVTFHWLRSNTNCKIILIFSRDPIFFPIPVPFLWLESIRELGGIF
jgi:hypothetical protein